MCPKEKLEEFYGREVIEADREFVESGCDGMIAEAKDITTAREAFLPISEVLISTAKTIHLPDDQGLFIAHCPMAFNNKGGSWLQREAVLANPYYGAMMLRCGSIKPLAKE